MKILVLTTTFPRWINDAIPAFVYDLSKRLQEKGHEIIVLAPHHEGAKKYEIIDGMKIYRFPYFYPVKYQRLVYDGGILSNLKRSHLAKIQFPLLFLSELYYSLKIIRKEKINLIHSNWIIPSGLIGAICRKIFEIKHIVTIHGTDIFMIKKLKVFRTICSFILRNSDQITANSNYTKDTLLSIDSKVEDKVEIIPMGVDTSIFNPIYEKIPIKHEINHLILSVGRLVEQKGIKYLIMSMKYVIKEFTNCKLLVCGSGSESVNLKNLTNELELNNNVIFTGHIKHEELPIYYTSADIFVMPSIETHQGENEGLGIVILEAMACGTPVIGSNVGGIKDIIKDNKNGFLIKPKNPEDIANKIIKLLQDEKLKQKFSMEGLKLIKDKFSWEVVTNMFFEEVLRL